MFVRAGREGNKIRIGCVPSLFVRFSRARLCAPISHPPASFLSFCPPLARAWEPKGGGSFPSLSIPHPGDVGENLLFALATCLSSISPLLCVPHGTSIVVSWFAMMKPHESEDEEERTQDEMGTSPRSTSTRPPPSRRSTRTFETETGVPEGERTAWNDVEDANREDENAGERGWLLGGPDARVTLRNWTKYACETVPAWWSSRTKHTRKVVKTIVASFSIALLLVLLLSWAVPEAEQGQQTDAHENPPGQTGEGNGADPTQTEDGGSQGQSTSDGGGMGDALCNWDQYTLPDAVLPRHYDLHLNVPLQESWLVSGNVVIHVDVLSFTRCIVLHAADMNITSAYVQTEQTAGLDRMTAKFNEDIGQVMLELDAPLNPTQALLNIHFNYVMKDDLRGLYRSNYQQGGKTMAMATTQFESVDARRAFPCFDEPALKATFNVSLTVPEGSATLFNTAEASRTSMEGKSVRRFKQTPTMSTYLLAMVVARDLVHVEKKVGKCTLSVWAVPKHGKKPLEYALDTAASILPHYEDMFGIDFPLEKLDLVAIPDFSAGAMENWGLITYRETDLLVREGNSSTIDYQNVAFIIAHEMAHQWFGNLVTMEWWDDLWLNEGFASYIEYVGANFAHPEFRVMEQFFPMTTAVALKADSLPSTHPIHMDNVTSDPLVESLFDDISYSKGAALIRMLRTYLFKFGHALHWDEGEKGDPFLRGVRQYLKKYKLSNARTEQLWDSLSEETGHPVGEWMESWSTQKGYPIVSMTTDKATGNIQLIQTPFQVGGVFNPSSTLSNCSSAADSLCWWIPVSWQRKSTPKQTSWSIMKNRTLGLGISYNCSDWIMFNAGQTGFYRVAYTGSAWHCLGESAKSSTEIAAVDLAGLIDDADALSTVGQVSVASLTKLLDALPYRKEDSIPEWTIASVVTRKLLSLLEEADDAGDSTLECTGTFKTWAANIFKAPLARVGESPVQEEPDVVSMLRPLLIETLTHFGDPEISLNALALVSQYANGSEPIDPGLRSPYFVLAARSGTSGYDKLEQIYLDAEDPQEKSRALHALAQVQDPALIDRTLSFAVGPSVRSQDTPHLLEAIARSSSMGRLRTWDFLKNNYDTVVEKKGGVAAGGSMASLVLRIARGFATVDMISEISNFFDAHPEARVVRLEQQARESVLANSEWLKRNHAGLCAFVDRVAPADSPSAEAGPP